MIKKGPFFGSLKFPRKSVILEIEARKWRFRGICKNRLQDLQNIKTLNISKLTLLNRVNRVNSVNRGLKYLVN